MKTTLRKFGNSQGVIIPKALLMQLGWQDEIEMTATADSIILSKPRNVPRQGWAQASQELAQYEDETLAWPELSNEEDNQLVWGDPSQQNKAGEW